ncbi:hypothetical protein TKK_0009920 [Trichogramma kaykai]
MRENNKEIYQLNRLLNTVISFEAPRNNRDLPQCYKCQEHGHTKNYCHKLPVCVKCAKNHQSINCPIKDKTNQGNHTASYKGCPVRKELQRKLYPSTHQKNLTHQNVEPHGP